MPFPELAARLADARGRIDAAAARGGHGQRVEIVAVTKTHGADAVEAAWACGVGTVGENKVQEALDKMPQVRAPVAWHLIGHLQRNKVKHVDRFSLLHSLDSERLARAVHEHGAARGQPVDVLVQVNVTGEATKGGYELATFERDAAALRALDGLRVRGAMTMAPYEASEAVLRETFSGARSVRDVLRAAGHENATELSMGMSGDYEIAVEEGATLVRLGTILFGARGATA
jgi:pyridoxal phosphate enzyme (YggS family)